MFSWSFPNSGQLGFNHNLQSYVTDMKDTLFADSQVVIISSFIRASLSFRPSIHPSIQTSSCCLFNTVLWGLEPAPGR